MNTQLDFKKQVLSFETCNCPKCQESTNPVGRFLTHEGKVHTTFCCAKDGVESAQMFRDLAIISSENLQELILAIRNRKSRMFPIMPRNPFPGLVPGNVKDMYLDHLSELCDIEAELRAAAT